MQPFEVEAGREQAPRPARYGLKLAVGVAGGFVAAVLVLAASNEIKAEDPAATGGFSQISWWWTSQGCDHQDCGTCTSNSCVWTAEHGCLTDQKANDLGKPIFSTPDTCGCLERTSCDACGSDGACGWCPGVGGYNRCVAAEAKNQATCAGYGIGLGACGDSTVGLQQEVNDTQIDGCAFFDCKSCASLGDCVWTATIGCLNSTEAKRQQLPVYSEPESCDCFQYEDCNACNGGSVLCSWCPGEEGDLCVSDDAANENRCDGYVPNENLCPSGIGSGFQF